MTKTVFLIEMDVPDEVEIPSEWVKGLVGNCIVKQLRFKTLSEYDDAQDEYWRWG